MVVKKLFDCYCIIILTSKQRFNAVDINWLSFLYKVMVAIGYDTPNTLDVVVKAGAFIPFSFSATFGFIPEFWVNLLLK